jgi:hypothetical protein
MIHRIFIRGEIYIILIVLIPNILYFKNLNFFYYSMFCNICVTCNDNYNQGPEVLANAYFSWFILENPK